MDIQTDLNWIHKEIDSIKDENFIEKLKNLLENFKNPKEDDAIYNEEINKALKNIEAGNYFSKEEARNTAKKWGRK